MAEPNAVAISKLLSDLVGRKVNLQPLPALLEQPGKQVFGMYQWMPWDFRVVVRADLALLGSLAGLLVGLPDSAVKDRVRTSPLDELLRDAVHEVLNISSAVIVGTGRAIFQRMVFDRALVDGAAGEVLAKPFHKYFFNVTLEGYQGGKFSILTPNIPLQ